MKTMLMVAMLITIIHSTRMDRLYAVSKQALSKRSEHSVRERQVATIDGTLGAVTCAT